MTVSKALLIVSLVLAILAGLGVALLPNELAWAFAFYVGSQVS